MESRDFARNFNSEVFLEDSILCSASQRGLLVTFQSRRCLKSLSHCMSPGCHQAQPAGIIIPMAITTQSVRSVVNNTSGVGVGYHANRYRSAEIDLQMQLRLKAECRQAHHIMQTTLDNKGGVKMDL